MLQISVTAVAGLAVGDSVAEEGAAALAGVDSGDEAPKKICKMCHLEAQAWSRVQLVDSQFWYF